MGRIFFNFDVELVIMVNNITSNIYPETLVQNFSTQPVILQYRTPVLPIIKELY